MNRKLISVLLILALGLTARTLAQEPALPDVGLRETPARLVPGTQIEATLAEAAGGARDLDSYRLALSEPGGLSLRLTHDYLDSTDACCVVRLVPLDGGEPLWERTVAGNVVESRFPALYPGKGEYELQIASALDKRIGYAIAAELLPAAATEREVNDTPDRATAIRLNEDVLGSLAMADDVDFYAFTLDAPGSVRLTLRHEYLDVEGACYQLTLGQGPNGDVLYAENLPGRAGEWTSPELFLAEGGYTLRVEPAAFTDASYTLRVDGAGDAGVERERNDAFADATPVAVNAAVRGSLTRDGDVDIYRFSLDAPAEVTLAHAHEYLDTDETLFIAELFDERLDGAWAECRLSGRDWAHASDALYLPAGTYYLRYRAGERTDVPYSFTVRAVPMAGIEAERNDTYAQATPLSLDAACSGSLAREGDEDFFRLTLAETSAVRIGFVFEFLDSDEPCFDLSLDLSPGDTYWRGSLAGRDNLFLSDELILPAGTCYLHLKAANWTGRPYTLRVAATPCASAEAERNETFAAATPMELGVPVKGILAGEDDVDCYRLTIDETRRIKLCFEHEWLDDGDVYYWIEFYRTPSGSGRMAKLPVLGSDGRKETTQVTLQPGTCYIRVYSERLSTAPYRLSIE